MNTFINLSSQQSKNIDKVIFHNARQLKKDALLIAKTNKSFSSANSLLILSSEEVIKAILILLHSEGYKVYQITDAKKFFFDHKIRHQLAQLLEMITGFIESVQKYENVSSVKLIKIKNKFWDAVINDGLKIIKASVPLLESSVRIKDLENFNDNKNNGLYVGYKDLLIVPQEKITETDYRKTKEIIKRIFRVYKTLRILHHPGIYKLKNQKEIDEAKIKIKGLIDEGMEGFSFRELSLK